MNPPSSNIEKPVIKTVAIELIHESYATQSRVIPYSSETASEYAYALCKGAEFPPVDLFEEDGKYWIGDGFHRVEATKIREMKEIQARVRPGTKRDAILFSISANRTHGLRRSNEDKEYAVKLLLDDQEWSQWSARKIAQIAGVSPDFAARLKKKLGKNPQGSILTQRNGIVYEMKAQQPQDQTKNQGMWHGSALEKIRKRLVTICRDYLVTTALREDQRHQAISLIQEIHQEIGDILSAHVRKNGPTGMDQEKESVTPPPVQG